MKLRVKMDSTHFRQNVRFISKEILIPPSVYPIKHVDLEFVFVMRIFSKLLTYDLRCTAALF